MKIKNFSGAQFSNNEGSSHVDITLPTIGTNVKISRAKLKLKVSSITLNENKGIKVNYSVPGVTGAGWTNIDYLIGLNDNDTIFLDITDELHDAYAQSAQTIRIEFVCDNTSDSINFANITSDNFDVDALSLAEFQSNGSNQEIDFGKAGKGSIDLATGMLSLTHVDSTNDNNVLPLSITHNYNTNKKDQNIFFNNHKLNSHCGNGWSLNVQQYLQRVTDNADDNATLKFKYLDANGKVQNIEEKYYYLDNNNKKHFVSREDLDVDLGGNLVLKEDSTVKIVTILEAPSGLKLNSSIKDFPTAKLVDYDPEELINLRKTIDTYEKNLAAIDENILSNQRQLFLLVVSKEYAIDICYKDVKNKTPLAILEEGKYKDIIITSSYFENINSTKEYISSALIAKFHKEFLDSSKNREDYTIPDPNDSGCGGTITDWDENGVPIISGGISTDPRETVWLEEKDIYSLDVQIKNTKKNIDDLKKQQEEIENDLTKYRHQLDLYEMQLPVHYLHNDNVIYGFAKASKEDENLFRLVLIADQYNNAIQINYEDFDSNKIISITDSAEKTVLFDYNQADLLTSITDSRDRKIKFEYDANHLIKVTYHNGKSTQYHYNENHELAAVIDQTGLGAVLTYENNKVTEVQAITILDSLKDNNAEFKPDIDYSNLKQYAINDQLIKFEYYDCQTTYITNSKGKKLVYVFNEQGQVINIYEEVISKISSEKLTQIKEFTYQSNKLTEATSILPYSINYLENTCFTNGCLSVEPALYLGQMVCSNYTYSVPSYTRFEHRTKHKFIESVSAVSVSMDETYINKLNVDKIENLVLSGWAEADSAFVYNPDIDEKFGTDEEIIYSDYITKRKFELRIKIKYAEEVEPQILTKQFNWRNTKWQYCALPIKLKPNLTIESITCYFDYSNNTNTTKVEFSDLQLREGTCEAKCYDNANHLIRSENHVTYTEYEYDEDDNLIKETTQYIHKPETPYTTTYEYDKNKKLIKKINYNGMITENVYDDKGICTKTMTYHRDDPTSKFYSEKVVDEKGNTTAATNDLGEVTTNYEYVAGTGIVATETDQDQNKVAYGYDNNDTLVACSSTINGAVNTNLYGYTLSFLTSLQHNDFAYNYEYDEQGRLNKVLVADQEYLTKTYDENSETTEYKNGTTYQQTYNDDGNVTKVKYNDTPLLENIYDSVGSLIQTTDQTTGEVHQYFYNKYRTQYKEESLQHGTPVNFENTLDEETGNVSKTQIFIGEQSLDYDYAYDDDLDAKLTQTTLPNGSVQTITYDKLGRTAAIKQDNLTKLFHYLKSGDHASNLVSSIWYGQDNAINENLTYKYDSKGNIIEVQENGKLICRYAYDALSRLIREDNKDLQKTVTYAYDAGGNIVCRTEYPFTLKETAHLENGVAFPYAYPVTGWRDQLLSYNGESFVYDQLGNPTTYRNHNLVWSHGRQLDQFGDIATYTYNANGIRTSKTINGSTTTFYLNGNKIIAQYNGNKMLFHYGVDGITGFTLDVPGFGIGQYTYKKNLQGDIIGIYDQNNNLICKYTYDAWGNHKILVLNNGVYESLDINSTTTNANIATTNPFRYRGYYYDVETGLYYLNSRYYDPELGRFINADDITNIDTNNLNGLNLYMYCANNPIINIDDNGNAWWNPFSWDWKKVGQVITNVVVTAAVVASVVAVTAAAVATGGILGVAIGAVGISMGIGAATGGISAIVNGTNYIGGLLSGSITGASTGVAIGLGILTGAGSIGLVPALAGVISTSYLTGNLAYAINTTANGEKFSWKKAIENGKLQIISGLFAFEAGHLIGSLNLYNFPKTMPQINSISSLKTLLTSKWLKNFAFSTMIKIGITLPVNLLINLLKN